MLNTDRISNLNCEKTSCLYRLANDQFNQLSVSRRGLLPHRTEGLPLYIYYTMDSFHIQHTIYSIHIIPPNNRAGLGVNRDATMQYHLRAGNIACSLMNLQGVANAWLLH